MPLSRGSRVRLHSTYAANARTTLPAGTVGIVERMYTIHDDRVRYVVAFDAIEAVLFRRDLELVAGQLAPC